jgi:hypothetical protein
MTSPEEDSMSSGEESPTGSQGVRDEDNSPESEPSTDRDTSRTLEPTDEVAMIVRGTPHGYDLTFLLLIRIDNSDSTARVDEMIPLGVEDESIIESIDFNAPPSALRRQLVTTRSERNKEGSLLDSELVRQKFEKLFNSVLRADKIIDRLRETPLSDVVASLEDTIREECFPGTQTDLEVRVVEWDRGEATRETKDTKQESNASESGEEDTSKASSSRRMLLVSPCVNALRGRKIGRLRPGAVFKVRVVGSSAKHLQSEYLDDNATTNRPFSRPLQGKLIQLKEGDTPQDVSFVVRLGQDIYGRGTVAKDTRVLANEQLVEGVNPLTSSTGRYFILGLILLVCIVLGTLIFI